MTVRPSAVGMKRRSFLRTYSRCSILRRISAYVDGRPMPFSSRNFTSEASLKRGGGCVSFFSGVTATSFSDSPSASGGRREPSFSASSSLLGSRGRRSPIP